MAVMHPGRMPRYGTGADGSARKKPWSEVQFFRQCRDQLEDEFHVFYSVRWHRTDENGMREDSECDFLVFAPRYGFLCIEVKGGTGIHEDKGGKWILEMGKGEQERELSRSPYIQAEESARFFQNYYDRETEQEFPGVYGYAVAFPLFAVEHPITVSSPLELTIDCRDMTRLKERIIEIFRYFRSRRRGQTTFLAPAESAKFIQLINKEVKLDPAASSLLPDMEEELERINFTQDAIIDLLTHYPRAFLVGGAGTGKTGIGVKKVLRCAREGKRALFLCYNKELARVVREQLPQEADCSTMDGLAARLLGDRVRSAPEKDGCRRYADLLLELPELPRYDLVVVDEGQDFSEDWAMCVNLLVEDGGALYVMYDENQNIFGRSFGDRFLIEEKPFVLRYNLRNTADIYRFTQQQTALGQGTIANEVTGVEPEERSFTRRAQAVAYLDNLISRTVGREGMPTEKMVLLSNRRRENSILSGVEELGGCRLVDDREDRVPGSLLFRTVQGFKGLEADTVIYLDHTYRNEPMTDEVRAMRYTAYTRARFYLHVIHYEDNGGTRT